MGETWLNNDKGMRQADHTRSRSAKNVRFVGCPHAGNAPVVVPEEILDAELVAHGVDAGPIRIHGNARGRSAGPAVVLTRVALRVTNPLRISSKSGI